MIILILYSLTHAVPPPTVTVTPMDGKFTIGDNIDLTCTVFADNVDEDAAAVIEWRRNKTVISVATVSVGESFTQTIYDIRLSEAGEYICSGYINSSNTFFHDSIIVSRKRTVNLIRK